MTKRKKEKAEAKEPEGYEVIRAIDIINHQVARVDEVERRHRLLVVAAWKVVDAEKRPGLKRAIAKLKWELERLKEKP